MNNSHELASTIRAQRKSKGLSQAEVAELVGIKQSTVSAFEVNPDSTKIDTLFRIIAAIGLQIDLKEKNKNQEDNSSW